MLMNQLHRTRTALHCIHRQSPWQPHRQISTSPWQLHRPTSNRLPWLQCNRLPWLQCRHLPVFTGKRKGLKDIPLPVAGVGVLGVAGYIVPPLYILCSGQYCLNLELGHLAYSTVLLAMLVGRTIDSGQCPRPLHQRLAVYGAIPLITLTVSYFNPAGGTWLMFAGYMMCVTGMFNATGVTYPIWLTPFRVLFTVCAVSSICAMIVLKAGLVELKGKK